MIFLCNKQGTIVAMAVKMPEVILTEYGLLSQGNKATHSTVTVVYAITFTLLSWWCGTGMLLTTGPLKKKKQNYLISQVHICSLAVLRL